MKGIVWMSVVSTLLAASAIINAWLGNTDFVLATGAASIATAVLATREK